ncbi:MAG: carboxylating nicotinate-nucleotide diphosphorylase [Calditrichia bacterium]
MSEPEMLRMREIIKQALQEDIGDGDITTDSIIPADLILSGEFIAKSEGVIAGLAVAELTFLLLDDNIQFLRYTEDGQFVKRGDIIAAIRGPAGGILKGERVALNFLQRMSGIATLTSRFVDEVSQTHARILDTRKTAPGLRIFDKWAVRLGGGHNHRFGLYDMVLIKDNHIAAAGSITEAVKRVRKNRKKKTLIETEVKNLDELKEALALGVDRILLDNMDPEEMREAVRINGEKIPLEASGNITLENAAEIAATGVDFISVGALTHSVTALDISLLFK